MKIPNDQFQNSIMSRINKTTMGGACLFVCLQLVCIVMTVQTYQFVLFNLELSVLLGGEG